MSDSNNYVPAIGDISVGIAQSKAEKLSNGFMSIDNTDIDQIAQQNQTSPRMIRTGTTRGDQQIKGNYTVVDENSTIRVLIGFKTGAF